MAVKCGHEMGTGGFCICPKCGEKLPHRRGIRCQEERCPACGAKLLREDSQHYRLAQEKQVKKQQKTWESSNKDAS